MAPPLTRGFIYFRGLTKETESLYLKKDVICQKKLHYLIYNPLKKCALYPVAHLKNILPHSASAPRFQR
jgi:hypothetical protein